MTLTVSHASGDAIRFDHPPRIEISGTTGSGGTNDQVMRTGRLVFTASEDAYGTEVFNILLQDDGGTDNGGVDTAAGLLLNITIRPVNDLLLLH